MSIKSNFIKAALGISTFVAINVATTQAVTAQNFCNYDNLTPLQRIVYHATDELNKGVSEKSEGPYGINYIMEAYKFPDCTKDEIKEGKTRKEIS